MRSQPSTVSAARVASGLRQYPSMTLSPRTSSSPPSPSRTSTPGSGGPTDSGTLSSSRLTEITGDASVMP